MLSWCVLNKIAVKKKILCLVEGFEVYSEVINPTKASVKNTDFNVSHKFCLKNKDISQSHDDAVKLHSLIHGKNEKYPC